VYKMTALKFGNVQTVLLEKCSQSEMQPHISSPELDDATISCQCCISCTGFLFDNESNKRWHVLFASRCQARHPCTWRITSTSLPTVVTTCSHQLPRGHASSHDHTTVLAPGASALRACVYGTNSLPS